MSDLASVEQPRRSAVRRRLAIAGAVLVTLAAAAAAAPVVMVAEGTRRSRSCFATYPRGTTPPDCNAEMSWFLTPAYVPWTSWDARYRAEELLARSAAAMYVDATVGRSDSTAQARAASALDSTAATVHAGSRRIAMDDLGPAMQAPNVGDAALDLGDRARLLERADRWTDWHVRKAALDAAILEGDLARAQRIAAVYAGFDPRDEDLRTQVGALLCLGADPRWGMALLTSIQDDRAARRHAAMSRDWGEVRAVLVACATRAKLEPPPKPTSTEAGRDDAPEARAALRLKLLGLGKDAEHAVESNTPPVAPADPAVGEQRREAFEAAAELVRGPARTEARRALLALLLAAGAPLSTAATTDLCRAANDSRDRPAAPPALTAADLLAEPASLEPVTPPRAFAAAAARLRKMAELAEDPEPLRHAAGELLVERARSLARASRADEAAAAVDEAAASGNLDAVARALLRSTAWYLAGDAARALVELEAIDGTALDASPAGTLRVAVLLQRAELLASLGRREDAGRAASAAESAAAASADRALGLRARLTRIALAPTLASPAAPGDAAARALRWEWVGFAAPARPWLRPESDHVLSRNLAAWSNALGASPDAKRAARYAWLAVRGDASPWPHVDLALGSVLAPAEGDTEIWLDAFYAVDAPRISRRAYAWSRAEAARWRGDAAAATRWSERYRALVAVAADPDLAEMARFLGIRSPVTHRPGCAMDATMVALRWLVLSMVALCGCEPVSREAAAPRTSVSAAIPAQRPLAPSALVGDGAPERPERAAVRPATAEERASYTWLPAPVSVRPLEATFAPPPGFRRLDLATGTFGAWLRRLPLRAADAPVRSHRGDMLLSPGDPRIAAVAELDVGALDLQQCADSVIRLHAEWLWAAGRKAEIRYHATSGDLAVWSRYAAGERPTITEQKMLWGPAARADTSRGAFRRYLDIVFGYAGTASLARRAAVTARQEVAPGAFFVLPGSPGHSVLVLDVARDDRGRLVALLGQGFMPAQDFQVLRSSDGVWFSLEADAIGTPFWPEPFPWSSLRRLPD